MAADLCGADIDDEQDLPTQTFARTVGTGKMTRQQQSLSNAEEFPPLVDHPQVSDDLDRQIAEMAAQLEEQLRRKKARIAAQRWARLAAAEDRTPVRGETEKPMEATKALEARQDRSAAGVWSAVLDTLTHLTHLIQAGMHSL